MNPADFYMDIVSGRLPSAKSLEEEEEAEDCEKESEQHEQESGSESLLNSDSLSLPSTPTNTNSSSSNASNNKKEKRIRHVLSLWDNDVDRPQIVERDDQLTSSHDPDYYIRLV